MNPTANDAFPFPPTEEERVEMQRSVADHVAGILDALKIEQDHNTADTPERVARMWVREIFAGRYEPMPCLTDFPNAKGMDQLYAVGPVAVRSCCAHHLVPILGQAWIGVIPGERLIGLSKFHRITNWIMARPQIQEEATEQLAAVLDDCLKPQGLGLIVRAKHFCTAWRGVRDEPSVMTTSVMRGLFRDDPAVRAEFMTLLGGMRFT